ncbi:anthranilate phosphoribosyltransferase [Companilactobacillus mishanensis]|uniref:Anthranilate phosphoribosyltransferase n=1 Tax=Companilactobacillus mishanensis TaxID=2486008 RepID=A0A5P0ZHM9_9LACO|nr:anthranilate phosphoribosyltransferase [Companilactobacillus mishanensis]MQS45495.1 anthranilate phosphoribosyltransferase [Companilactobacillus mishanensis]MQS52561.1 anthranilate phosphoribosyltransferase [Companilactobacillus mishanensis]
MIENAIKKLTEGSDLTFDETNKVIDEIMTGKTTSIQISSFLTALSVKKETVEEIAGAADAMRAHALEFDADEPVLEIVGTGGDHSNSFNISTTSALVVAATGIPVAKHGNRAASSKSGAADVLESLGVQINLDPKQSEAILNEIGICFLFAQEYHKAMKYVAPVRKELGIRTLFNVLGPLANPAHATSQVLGVYDENLVEPMAKVLDQIGVKNAMVIHGQDGFDEASISAPTTIMEVHNGKFTKYEITPEQFGLKRADKSEVIGGTPEENAQITLDVLNGKQGAKRDVILLNSALAIHTAKPEINLEDAIDIARNAIDNGLAIQKLNDFVKLTVAGVAA